MLSILLKHDPNTTDIKELSPYGYIPTLWVCILFLTLFSVATFGHFVHACYSRAWFILPTVILAGLLEILGWTGRLWSAKNIFADAPFKLQICATIFGPTPLLAATFVVFGRLIRRLGTSYSLLRPRLYTGIFLSCDVLALAIQGLGGGIASAGNKQSTIDMGSNIMLAGIVFQLAVILTFVTLATLYWRRYRHDRPLARLSEKDSTPRGQMDTRLQLLIYALIFSTTCLTIRGIYRIVELATGWNGIVMTTEWLFCIFDGLMVTLAMYIILLLPPALLLTPPAHQTSKSVETLESAIHLGRI